MEKKLIAQKWIVTIILLTYEINAINLFFLHDYKSLIYWNNNKTILYKIKLFLTKRRLLFIQK